MNPLTTDPYKNETQQAKNHYRETLTYLKGKLTPDMDIRCGMKALRLATACRRLKFELVKSLGVFWLIERIPGMRIKQPWRKMYERSKLLTNT